MVEEVLFSPERLAAAPSDVDAIVGLLGVAPGAKILDLCAGPGGHAIEFARRGFEVTAVDRTSFYVERARRSAQEAAVAIEFVEEDMRRFQRESAFDAVVNLYTSFGYFEDPVENRRVAENIRISLKPDGAALFELVGREVLARDLRPRWWIEVGDTLCLEERSVKDDWSRIESRWILVKNGEKQEYKVKHWLYSGTELRQILLDAGFRTVDLFGTLDGASYDRDARRLVAVARK